MKQKISILINGKEQTYSECKHAQAEETENEANLTKTEMAAAAEEVSLEGYTILAAPLKKSDPFLKRKKINVLPHKRTGFSFQQKGKSLSKQIIAAIMAAVVTGTGLGLLVLMVFSTDITEAGNHKTEASAMEKTEAPAETKLAVLPPIKLEFSVLQAGVFSKERAEDAVKTIEEKGLSAISIPADDGKFSVIVGIANENHQLERYSESFQKEMEKPYAKKLSYTFEDLKTSSSLDETYFKNGNVLLQNVLTLSQLPGTNESGLDQTLTGFNKWKQYGKKQQKSWKADTAKAASDFEKQLEGAFLALKDTKKGDVNWAFQQKAMDSLEAYKKLLNTLK